MIMINRSRTAFVSVATVAVSMILLGSDARARSVSPAAPPQNYVRFLEMLASREIKTGNSLMGRLSSLEKRMNRLESIPQPGPRLARLIATQEKIIFNQELIVFSMIHHNINSLLATQADLQALPLPLPPREQAQISKLLSSIQKVVVAEKGVATPVQ